MLGCGGGHELRPTSATAATYTRADTDTLTVVTPTLRAAARYGDAVFDGAYTVDAWSGASIDIRTAASPNVDEVRHEVQLGGGYESDDLTLGGRYRGSFEPDYVSNGASARAVLELDHAMTTLSLDVFGSVDDVGRSGDPWFHRLAGRVGGQLGWTQILDPETLVALTGELQGVLGYQASPYRFVAIGGEGTCAGGATFCVPEHLPDDRFRSAIGVRGRRALGPHFSAGLFYRLYGDSWGVVSHTAEAELSMAPTPAVIFSFGYRFYVQGEASFYQPRYFETDVDFVTRDRKLSAFVAHQVGAELSFLSDLDEHASLSLAIRASGTAYEYRAFVGLTEVYALELTVTSGLRFR